MFKVIVKVFNLTNTNSLFNVSRRQSAARREYLTRFEKKYMAFGEKSDEEPNPSLPFPSPPLPSPWLSH